MIACQYIWTEPHCNFASALIEVIQNIFISENKRTTSMVTNSIILQSCYFSVPTGGLHTSNWLVHILSMNCLYSLLK